MSSLPQFQREGGSRWYCTPPEVPEMLRAIVPEITDAQIAPELRKYNVCGMFATLVCTLLLIPYVVVASHILDYM